MKSADEINVFLTSGEYFVGDSRHRIRTLLGSCVSITLWHPDLRIGAMSHFLLSQRPARLTGPPDARYGQEALSLMLRDLRHQGVDSRECQGLSGYVLKACLAWATAKSCST